MPEVLPYEEPEKGTKKEQVTAMFNNIANKYDLLNQTLSMGIHKIWRKKAISFLKKQPPQLILDVATGTADFAIESMKLSPKKVIGIDISQEMLNIGIQKVKRMGLHENIALIKADSENLPFEDNTFDAITVGFGVRNFENLEKGLHEMNRVLKKKGIAVILEFSKPETFIIKQLYNLYFRFICPFVGKIISRDNHAYGYLQRSVYAFPDRGNFIEIMKKNGYVNCQYRPLSFGIACIYTGIKQ